MLDEVQLQSQYSLSQIKLEYFYTWNFSYYVSCWVQALYLVCTDFSKVQSSQLFSALVLPHLSEAFSVSTTPSFLKFPLPLSSWTLRHLLCLLLSLCFLYPWCCFCFSHLLGVAVPYESWLPGSASLNNCKHSSDKQLCPSLPVCQQQHKLTMLRIRFFPAMLACLISWFLMMASPLYNLPYCLFSVSSFKYWQKHALCNNHHQDREEFLHLRTLPCVLCHHLSLSPGSANLWCFLPL